MTNRITLKFSDCRFCVLKRTSTCFRCTTGEYFEEREPESDEGDVRDLYDLGLEMTRDD